jgi:hypothetical protein
MRITMKAVTDFELIAVTHSEAMAVTIGAKRRWRMDLDRTDRHPSKNSMRRSPIRFWEERNRSRRRRVGNFNPTETRRAAPSLCGGSVNLRAILLTEDQTLFCNPAEARFTFSASIFRLSKNQPAIKKPKDATIWRTTAL